MAIDQKKYISIISGVGGEASASRRLLIGRVMTTSILAPTNQILEMNLAGVLSHFGSSSAEYAFALKYFGFISKSITQADLISFARYTPTATAPMLKSTATLTGEAVSTGGSTIVNLGGETLEVTGISAANSDALATELEGAIQANVGGGSMWTAATVTHSSGVFTITGGATGDHQIGYLAPQGSGTDISSIMGLDVGSSPILSVGMVAETTDEAIARVDGISDNFGSFSFLTTLTNSEITGLAEWNTANNYKYLYSVQTTVANAATLAPLIDGNTGTIVTLDANADYAEYMPMALFATTDYDKINSVKNFMFQQFDTDTPSVTSDTASDTYDALKINYLGETQKSGQLLSFYQDGVMMDGGDVAPYCNEIWLKDALATEFMNLLLALEQIAANATGESVGVNAIQGVLTEAKDNGTIQPGKTLTNTQKAYITQLTGDEDAWVDVQSVGYWLDVVITSSLVNEVTIHTMNYTLVYGKSDSVRKVEGTDILI